MNRYSMLYGSDSTGKYGPFPETAGLYNFLMEIGADDPEKTAKTAQSYLHGFEQLLGYAEEAIDSKPVAVRYAPMHLYRLSEMPKSLREFCALSVSGFENLPKRNSVYSLTTIISLEDMLQESGINYLDQLFGVFEANGFRWFSDIDMQQVRQGNARIDTNLKPGKVCISGFSDLSVAIRAVAAIFHRKNIILRTEQGYSFNRRAVEILRQIYSLMSPRMAIETGFAVYHNPDRIEELLNSTSIHIFVIPHEALLRRQPQNTIEIDLSVPMTAENTPLSSVLSKWAMCDWSTQRQPAMSRVFQDIGNNYLNPDIFIEKSEQFFQAAVALAKWKANNERRSGTCSIEELMAEYNAHTEWWKLVPWGEETFQKLLSKLIGEKQLSTRNAELFSECFQAKEIGQTIDPHARALFHFGVRFAKVDEARLCRSIWDAQERNIEKARIEDQQKLDAAQSQYDLERNELINEKTVALDAAETAKAKISDLENERTSLNKTIEDLRSDIEDANSAKTDLEKENSRLQQEKGTLGEKIIAHEKTISELKEEKEAISGDLEKERKKVEDLEGDCRRIKTENEILKSDKTYIQDELDSKITEYDDVKKERDALQDKLKNREENAKNRPAILDSFRWWVPLLSFFCIGVLITGLISIIFSSKSSDVTPETTSIATPGTNNSSEIELHTTDIESSTVESESYDIASIERNQLINLLVALEEENLNEQDYTDDSFERLKIAVEQAHTAKGYFASDSIEIINQAIGDLNDARRSLVIRNYSFSDWTNQTTQEQLILRIPEIRTILIEPHEIEEYCPESLLESCKALAIFSTQEREEGQMLTKRIVLLEGNIEETTICTLTDNLFLSLDNFNLLVTGGDEEAMVAFKILSTICPISKDSSSQKDDTERTPDKHSMPTGTFTDPTEEDMNSDVSQGVNTNTNTSTEISLEEQRVNILFRVLTKDDTESLVWVVLTDSSNSPDWYTRISQWTTDSRKLENDRKEVFGSTKQPVLCMYTDTDILGLFDYRTGKTLDELEQAYSENKTVSIKRLPMLVLTEDATVEEKAVFGLMIKHLNVPSGPEKNEYDETRWE